MISRKEVYKIGMFNKPHGIHGELLFSFTDDIFDRVDCNYLICPIDGIFVPFFIKEYRFKSDTTVLMLLEDIDTVEKARMFTNVDVYFPIKYISEENTEERSPNYFIGFTVCDIRQGVLGKIKDVDDSTSNLLFEVEDGKGRSFLIPVHDELIKEINHKQNTITFDLPEGLLTMNDEERD